MPEPVALGDDDVLVRVEGVVPVGTGHALVGRGILAGARADRLRGRRLVAGPLRPCGECEVCRRGGAAACPLAPAAAPTPRPGDEVVVAARWATALELGLDHATLGDARAALVAGDAAIAYAMYARAGVEPREPTIVVGSGPLARCLVDVLVAKGAPPIIVAEGALADDARGKGLAVVAPGAGPAAWKEAALAREHGARPWRIFVTVGGAPALREALAAAGPRATVVVWADEGLPAGGDLGLAAALAREVSVLGVVGAHPDLVLEVAALVVRGDLDLVAVTTAAGTPDASRAVVAGLD